jgi:hypothetical protein
MQKNDLFFSLITSVPAPFTRWAQFSRAHLRSTTHRRTTAASRSTAFVCYVPISPSPVVDGEEEGERVRRGPEEAGWGGWEGAREATSAGEEGRAKIRAPYRPCLQPPPSTPPWREAGSELPSGGEELEGSQGAGETLARRRGRPHPSSGSGRIPPGRTFSRAPPLLRRQLGHGSGPSSLALRSRALPTTRGRADLGTPPLPPLP